MYDYSGYPMTWPCGSSLYAQGAYVYWCIGRWALKLTHSWQKKVLWDSLSRKKKKRAAEAPGFPLASRSRKTERQPMGREVFVLRNERGTRKKRNDAEEGHLLSFAARKGLDTDGREKRTTKEEEEECGENRTRG